MLSRENGRHPEDNDGRERSSYVTHSGALITAFLLIIEITYNISGLHMYSSAAGRVTRDLNLELGKEVLCGQGTRTQSLCDITPLQGFF